MDDMSETVEGSAAGGGRRILLAEDDERSRRFVSDVLTDDDHTVIEVADGEAALAELNAPDSSFDLIISDIMMPVADGIAVVQAVRADSRLAELLMLALSAMAHADDIQRVLDAGLDAYLTKPVSVRDLRAVSDLAFEPDIRSALRAFGGRADDGPRASR